MLVERGYMRTRNNDSGDFNVFLPITDSDSVNMGVGVTLTDKLAEINTTLESIKDNPALAEDVEDLKTKVAAIEETLVNQAPSQQILDAIDEVDAKVTLLKTDVDMLKTDTQTLKTDTQTLKTNTDTMKTDVDSLKTTVGKLPIPASLGADLPTSITGSSTKLAVQDTRNSVVNPIGGVSWHLTSNSTDGLADGGTYHNIMNCGRWTDTSGGNSHQLGFTDNGNIWLRTFNGTSYSAWTLVNFIQNTANRAGYMDMSATAPTGTTRLNYSGYFYATRVYNAVYNDYAEYFEKDIDDVEPGDVIAMNPNGDGYIGSTHAFDTSVVGVFTDDYAQCIGGNGDGNDEENFIAVGMAGRVRVKVVGEVKKGQLLVASDIPKVAMAVPAGMTAPPGTIIGKALQNHTGGSIDRIKALILNA